MTLYRIFAPMKAFFARYPPFRYNPQQSPTSEFARLRATKPNWTNYNRARTQFRLFLNEKNASSTDPVTVFFSGFPEFDYDAEKGNLDVYAEFERLAVLKHWAITGPAYHMNRHAFDVAAELAAQTRQQTRAEPGEGVEAVSRSLAALHLDGQDGQAAKPHLSFKPSSGQGPLDAFFRAYGGFQYNPLAPASSEYKRLKKQFNWGSKKLEKARVAFLRATANEVMYHLGRKDLLLSASSDESSEEGSDVEDALPWQRLCAVLDLRMPDGTSSPKSKTQCRKVHNESSA